MQLFCTNMIFCLIRYYPNQNLQFELKMEIITSTIFNINFYYHFVLYNLYLQAQLCLGKCYKIQRNIFIRLTKNCFHSTNYLYIQQKNYFDSTNSRNYSTVFNNSNSTVQRIIYLFNERIVLIQQVIYTFKEQTIFIE